jgi:hypothetical protein
VAITAQHFRSISTGATLFASDGISKTTVWKERAQIKGTSQMRERSSSGMPVPTAG